MRKSTLIMALMGGLLLRLALKRKRKQVKTDQWLRLVPGTAVITGASSGIGAAFARALARRGYNLVLLARRGDRLYALAAEIQNASPVRVEVLPVDLSDPAQVEQAAALIGEIEDLSLLVNNAGFGTGGSFAEIDIRRELDMIQVHVMASVRLTRAALPGMLARHHGGIIQVSSIAGLIVRPQGITYGATKSYLNFFTEGLNYELRGSGVRAQALCPGLTYSEFHDVIQMDRSSIPAFLWMNAEDVVEESLRGLREDEPLVIPGAWNRLLAWLITNPLLVPLIRFGLARGLNLRLRR